MDYSETVRHYFDEPGRAGNLKGTAGYCVSGSAGRESEGLRIWLAARIVDDHCVEACFRAYGCPYTIAMAAFAAEKTEGLDQASVGLAPLEAARELGLPDEKLACALCAEDALADLKTNWGAARKSM
ncbi:MAG: hypothetical protein HKN59_04405 [Gammaproteobacteria bacterium]|nr:hypothetical protein [Gammaproteobacteria bacterium]